MSEKLEVWADEPRACYDPECDGVAEPEQDGDHRYYECQTCGYAFDHERVPETVIAQDTESGHCSVGVPEAVRRAASAPMTKAIAEEERKQPVPLGLTIGRRPGS